MSPKKKKEQYKIMFIDYLQNKYAQKKTIITCHRNADFDALTALVGISLFFPDAQLVFPGTQEKILQEFYEDVVQPLFHCISPKEADYENIERLVVVDTQNIERIDHLMPLLLKHNIIQNEQKNNTENDKVLEKNNSTDSLEILIWDHHPVGNLRANGGNCALVGSSCTLVCEEIKEVFGKIPCEFAHLIGLGIYVDTGSFTYISTTPRDYFASAWLVEQGFSPDFVSSYTHRSLNRDQLCILNDLVESAQIIDLAGIRFVIAFARTELYVNDFASLIPQFMELNPCQVLFALVAMNDTIQVVARSKEESFDVGRICHLLGGGGHAYAAAVMVKDKTLPELINFLQTQISFLEHTDKTAKRLMTSPVVAVFEFDSMNNAENIMSHYGLKAIPVYKKETKICIGWLEHQLAIKAISHGLGSVAVTAYMQRHFRVVTQEASLQILMDIIVGERQRLVPVVNNKYLETQDSAYKEIPSNELPSDSLDEEKLLNCPVFGVITRTDLIRIFLDENKVHLPTPRQKSIRKRNVTKMLSIRTPAQCVKLLEIVGQLASECGVDIYVVGGFVRDLLMDNHESRWPHMDVDLVVEGDGIAFAHKLVEILKGRVREHTEFLTALVIFNVSTLEALNRIQTNDIFEYETGEYCAESPNYDLLQNIDEVKKQNTNFTKELTSAETGNDSIHSVENITDKYSKDSAKSAVDKSAKNLNKKLATHPENISATGSVQDSDFELRIDVATARLEYYQSPAALPTVELSSIRMDLTRRDFSINAMAIHLNSEHFGDLVDFFDGQNDIKQKRIRMLHALSFVEDPTRALRAVRFEQRYDFKIGAHCDRLIRNSVELKLIEKLSGRRVLAELALILKEADPLSCLLRLQEFNLLSAIHPTLELSTKEKQEFLEECYKVLDWYKLLYLEEEVDRVYFFILAICRSASTADLKDLLHRLSFIPMKTQEVLSTRSILIHAIAQLEEWSAGKMLMSELHIILQGLPIEALLFLVARSRHIAGEELQKRISLYIYKSRLETIDVTGEDLLNMGIVRGPLIGIILREVLAAKMDEEVSGFDEEIDFAEQRAAFYAKENI